MSPQGAALMHPHTLTLSPLPSRAPARQMQTTTRSRTLSPVWNEPFTLLVHSHQHQELTMVLFDSGADAAWRVLVLLWWLLGLVREICHAAIALELTNAIC
jgi:hypothetical protein